MFSDIDDWPRDPEAEAERARTRDDAIARLGFAYYRQKVTITRDEFERLVDGNRDER